MVAVNRKPIQVWWCNQSICWKGESEAGVVCSSREGVKRLKFRRTVGQVEQGDIIVHYRKQKGIFAISRALENGREEKKLPDLGGHSYGSGWRFPADYFFLGHPIIREKVNKQVQELDLPDSPILERSGNVRQDYFIPFSLEGIRIIRQASHETWPDWAEKALDLSPPVDNGGVEGFLEGGEHVAAATIRSDTLRQAAKKKWGLSCYCCGFTFEAFYGSVAHGKAIVHHLETFESATGTKRESTVNDVRVVCANCHYVIHFEKTPMPVDELKNLVAESWTPWSKQGINRR
jgi:hypothetical protein